MQLCIRLIFINFPHTIISEEKKIPCYSAFDFRRHFLPLALVTFHIAFIGHKILRYHIAHTHTLFHNMGHFFLLFYFWKSFSIISILKIAFKLFTKMVAWHSIYCGHCDHSNRKQRGKIVEHTFSTLNLRIKWISRTNYEVKRVKRKKRKNRVNKNWCRFKQQQQQQMKIVILFTRLLQIADWCLHHYMYVCMYT